MSRLAYPFGVAADGRSATVAFGSDEHVRQMLELLILTMPGERVMRPELGSPVRQMLFGAGNGPVAIALQATLEAAIRQWLGDLLELHSLSAEFDESESTLVIEVTYEVLATKSAAQLKLVRKDLA